MIRLATLDDLPQIVAIYNEAIDARWATADLEPLKFENRLEWFNSHDPSQYPIYVFEENKSVLGWCSLSPYRFGRAALKRTAEITYYVSYFAHHRGVGSKLVSYTLEQAPKFGIRVLFGILLEKNAASVAIMKKFGFEQWAYLPEVADFEGELVGHLYYGRKVGPTT